MFRMIIADDEPAITKGIQMLVDWNQLGIEIIGVFDNGNDALQSIYINQPDVAILDISMPGKTGLEIIKEIAEANSPTKVIFQSGFQDFKFAQTALRYGAKDYLLKPVKKDSLIEAVQKCINFEPKITTSNMTLEGDSFLPSEAYQKLAQMGETKYVLCAVHCLGFESSGSLERQFVLFSVINQLKVYLESVGVVFQKNGKIWSVLTGNAANNPLSFLQRIRSNFADRYDLGFVYGSISNSIGGVKDCVSACLDTLGYFYFGDALPSNILEAGKVVFDKPSTIQQLDQLRDSVVTYMFEQNYELMQKQIQEYEYAACTISGSKSDAAVYYLLSCIRAVEERFEELSIPIGTSQIVETMNRAGEASLYSQVVNIFVRIIDEYYKKVTDILKSGDKKDILKAKEYIDNHYAENLTLEVMAKVVHMNSYYFSSFFKKQTGENFKDYLNKVRLKHGMEMLIMSDMRIYEIAETIGFKDYRYFTELFSRVYGKTPMAYRKQSKE